MKRLFIVIILVYMIIPIQGMGYHTMAYGNGLIQTFPSIDSITIIYECIEMSVDNIKITVTPSQGVIQSVKNRNSPKLYEKREPQKLCEWQRREIFDTLVGIYVTGNVKIGKGKMPTHNAYYSTPPEMFVTIYSEGNIQKEHLTIYDINDDDEFKYSNEFDRLDQLLAVLLLVFMDGLPIVC